MGNPAEDLFNEFKEEKKFKLEFKNGLILIGVLIVCIIFAPAVIHDLFAISRQEYSNEYHVHTGSVAVRTYFVNNQNQLYYSGYDLAPNMNYDATKLVGNYVVANLVTSSQQTITVWIDRNEVQVTQ